MTIKQQGGVFGRNPTFNDVTIEGQLTFDGDIDVNSDLKVDGDLEVTGTSSLQNVGILNSSPTAPLTIGYSGAEAQIQINNSGGSRMIYAGAFSEDEGIFRIFNSSNTEVVRIAAETTAGVYTYFNAGNVGVGTTTPSAKLSVSGGNISVDSGYGIDFSATAQAPGSTSELLDDYEEGTWTPTLVGSSSAGTATFVTGPNGFYTKIGNQVTVYFDWNISAHTGTGALRVTGLPFALGSGVGVGTIMDGNYTYSAGRTKLVPYVVSSSILRIYQVGDGVGYIENVLDTSHQINGSVTYTV